MGLVEQKQLRSPACTSRPAAHRSSNPRAEDAGVPCMHPHTCDRALEAQDPVQPGRGASSPQRDVSTEHSLGGGEEPVSPLAPRHRPHAPEDERESMPQAASSSLAQQLPWPLLVQRAWRWLLPLAPPFLHKVPPISVDSLTQGVTMQTPHHVIQPIALEDASEEERCSLHPVRHASIHLALIRISPPPRKGESHRTAGKVRAEGRSIASYCAQQRCSEAEKA